MVLAEQSQCFALVALGSHTAMTLGLAGLTGIEDTHSSKRILYNNHPIDGLVLWRRPTCVLVFFAYSQGYGYLMFG